MSFWEPSFIPKAEPFAAFAEPCENCGRPVSGERIWIPGYSFWACEDCAEESRILYFAEENCPTLYDAIMRAKSVQEVRFAFQAHLETCPKCQHGEESHGRLDVTVASTGDDLPLQIRKGPALASVPGEDEQERAA